MSFTADLYLTAARERVPEAQTLYRSGHYVLAHYVAGVATECLLRAYRFRRDPEFDSRHDLYRLYFQSGLQAVLRPEEAYKAYAALVVVSFRWANDYRYRSEADLRRHLKRLGADRGIRGDYVKENARRIVSAASELVTVGVRAWKR